MALGNDCSQHCGGGIIQIFQMLLLRKCLARPPFVMLFITTAIYFLCHTVTWQNLSRKEFNNYRHAALVHIFQIIPMCTTKPEIPQHHCIPLITGGSIWKQKRNPHVRCSTPRKQALWCYMKSQPISLSSYCHFISPQSISSIYSNSLTIIALNDPLLSFPPPVPTAGKTGRIVGILWKAQKQKWYK